MSKAIEDEFTHLRVSRQRKYQLRRRRANRCRQCGKPALCSGRCLKHLVEAREWQRKRYRHKRRYRRALTYRLAAK